LLGVCQLARAHVKVALSGEGADEVLAGYGFNATHRKFETMRRIQSFPPSLLTPIGRVLSLVSEKHGNRFAKAASTPLSQWNIANKSHMTWYWGETEKAALWPTLEARRDSDSILRSMYAAARSQDPLDQILSVYQKSWLVENLLMKADKMSMAAS